MASKKKGAKKGSKKDVSVEDFKAVVDSVKPFIRIGGDEVLNFLEAAAVAGDVRDGEIAAKRCLRVADSLLDLAETELGLEPLAAPETDAASEERDDNTEEILGAVTEETVGGDA